VLRNMGVALGYAVLGYDSLSRGLDKLEVNHDALAADLDAAWEVLAEPIQTVMRRFNVDQPYEKLKALTRGQKINQQVLSDFVEGLDIPEEGNGQRNGAGGLKALAMRNERVAKPVTWRNYRNRFVVKVQRLHASGG
jgi:adenylosuccinate lyase